MGVKVPCALPGAILPGDFKIKPTKMRGVESGGMLCSGKELGVPEDVDGLMLRHHADLADLRPELSGHFHPKHSSAARGRRVTRPCFVEGARKLILPSFGALTGGMPATHPEIVNCIGGIVAIISCGAGLRATSGAMGVGAATRKAVRDSIIAIINRRNEFCRVR